MAVDVSVDDVTGLGGAVGVCRGALEELGVRVRVVVGDGDVELGGGLGVRVVVGDGEGDVVTDLPVVGTVMDSPGVAAVAMLEVVDDCGIGVAMPAPSLQPLRVTVRAASAHPSRIRTAAG
jgi:hypothetical protein